jgi:ABC-2 type transport system ATP-binding protein
MSSAERKRRIPAMLERVGLRDAGRLQLRKFSKGMLQRVGIAQAILHDPKIVFLDEPMSGLDPVGRREVRDLILQLKSEGKTVFFSTHILSDAEALCDRVAVLHKGELRGIGSVLELTHRGRGTVEVIWEGAASLGAVAALGVEVQAAGEVMRTIVAEQQLDPVIEAVRRNRGRLVSVNPVRGTLEDYFVEKLAEEPTAAREVAK